MNNLDDSTLLQQIAAADSTALGLLYDRYGRLIYSISFQIVNDAILAEEVTQDVFVQVWKKASTYDSTQGKVTTWLISIARNRTIDQLRRRKIRPESRSVAWDDCCEDNADSSIPIELGVIDTERRTVLLTALSALPTDQREALSLAYFNGMTQQEIADTLHQPLGTIKTRIRLALQKLRTTIESQPIRNE